MTAGASAQAGSTASSGAPAASGSSAAGVPNSGSAAVGGTTGAAGEPSDAAGRGGEGAAILAPLDTSDATLDATSGAELLKLALQIGYARGWAMCTCLSGHPLSAESLQGCAEEESTYRWLYQQPGPSECLLDKAKSVPGFEERLRCRTRSLRAEAKVYAACAQGTETRPLGVSFDCGQNERADMMIGGSECYNAFLCGDGARFDTGHCDLKVDCEDGADERGCSNVLCGDKLVDRFNACNPEYCDVFDPPLCEVEPLLRVFCGDGQHVSFDQLCDGKDDCATGRDEQYCF